MNYLCESISSSRENMGMGFSSLVVLPFESYLLIIEA